MQTHRQAAKRKTVIWQGAAVAILAAAGVAAALPAVGGWFNPPRAPEPPTPPPPPPPSTSNLNDLPVATVSRSLRGVSNFVALPTAPPPDATAVVGKGGNDTPPPPPAQAGDWAYIGSIITPANRHALVRINGQQQIFSLGAKFNDDKLVSIEPDFIEIEAGGAKRKVELASRTLLAPMDPPKRPVVFRQPPNLGAAGAAGAMMSMNQPQVGLRPGTPPMQPPGTMDQARINQASGMAAAEAARRAQQPVDPPIIPMDRIDSNDREVAAKYLNEPSLGDDERLKHLSSLGIVPGTSVDAAIGRLKESGVDLGGDNYKRILNVLESNAKGKP